MTRCALQKTRHPIGSTSTSEDPAGGVAAALIGISRKRRVSSSRARNKPKRSKAGGGASDIGKRLVLPKPPGAISSGVFRALDVPQSIVNAYRAMMETKPWDRYFDLPSIFPDERANAMSITVDASRMSVSFDWQASFPSKRYI
ncbi:hypothetical protein Ae201684P_008181 [Aphanomyces euteiches]|nr:hypothetical protein Ae201684P_008181 [Aphanomyces euteiches]